jgi:hypothetical protein
MLTLRPTQLTIQWEKAAFVKWIKQRGDEAHHSPATSALCLITHRGNFTSNLRNSDSDRIKSLLPSVSFAYDFFLPLPSAIIINYCYYDQNIPFQKTTIKFSKCATRPAIPLPFFDVSNSIW